MFSLLAACVLLAVPQTDVPTYAIVVSDLTYGDEQWREVVTALREKHGGTVIRYDSSLDSSLPVLRAAFPRYTCFVATSAETTRVFVAAVHQLTRNFDDDPYTDTLWGILTGMNAADALKVALQDKPLIVHKVASGTEIAMEMVEQGVSYCELKQNHMIQKELGGVAQQKRGPTDTTAALVGTLNDYQADLFVTSGHATERDWQIGFRYRNGSFRSRAGRLWGVDTEGKKLPIASPHPKAYLAVGNCLMGHIDGPDAMALAWMHSAGVYQMVGYTVPTWFGYGGWGLLDYFLEQPGRYTLAEAFRANNLALVYCLENSIGSERGLRYDRDVVAFYGDPAWSVRMANRPLAYGQKLEQRAGVFTLTITGNRGEKSFAPINTNGSQRGGRPIIELLPYRIANVEILEDSGLAPVITDDFVLVPNPRHYDAAKVYRVRFRADRVRANRVEGLGE